MFCAKFSHDIFAGDSHLKTDALLILPEEPSFIYLLAIYNLGNSMTFQYFLFNVIEYFKKYSDYNIHKDVSKQGVCEHDMPQNIQRLK